MAIESWKPESWLSWRISIRNVYLKISLAKKSKRRRMWNKAMKMKYSSMTKKNVESEEKIISHYSWKLKKENGGLYALASKAHALWRKYREEENLCTRSQAHSLKPAFSPSASAGLLCLQCHTSSTISLFPRRAALPYIPLLRQAQKYGLALCEEWRETSCS